MTNSEFMKRIAERSGMSRPMVAEVMDAAKDIIFEQLAAEDPVKIKHLGTFLSRRSKGKMIRIAYRASRVANERLRELANKKEI